MKQRMLRRAVSTELQGVKGRGVRGPRHARKTGGWRSDLTSAVMSAHIRVVRNDYIQ